MKKAITKKKLAKWELRNETLKEWENEAERLYNERVNSGRADGRTLHVTEHSKEHKLCGIQSLNTPVVLNPVCLARIKHAVETNDTKCVCLHCYADSLLSCRTNMIEPLAYNMHILNSRELTDEDAARVPIFTKDARVESFGDSATDRQARNYIRIIRTHKHSQFGIWSKNAGIWARAFSELGKPENCTFVLSSCRLDEVATVPDCIKPYTDHVFTVCSDTNTYEQLLKAYNGNCAACAGISCEMQCGTKCYHRDTPYYIFELVR